MTDMTAAQRRARKESRRLGRQWRRLNDADDPHAAFVLRLARGVDRYSRGAAVAR